MKNNNQHIYDKYVTTHTKNNFKTFNLRYNNAKRAWKRYFGKTIFKYSKNSKILDLGCGEGGFLYWLRVIGYEKTIGVDISREQVDLAKQNGMSNVIRSDAVDYLKTSKVKFDIIIARDLIEHFQKEKVISLLKLIKKRLSKNGTLIIQTPNSESPLFGRYFGGDFTHQSIFSKRSLSQILMYTNFRNIQFFATGPVVHSLTSFIRFVLWRLINLGINIYHLVETGEGNGIYTQTIICVAKNELEK